MTFSIGLSGKCSQLVQVNGSLSLYRINTLAHAGDGASDAFDVEKRHF